MNELTEVLKKSIESTQEGAIKFAEDPLWESQAWLLRASLNIADLNSVDQQKAREEAASNFALALKTGLYDCNDTVDLLLKRVFQVDEAPLALSADNASRRYGVDPPSKVHETVVKKDPEPITIKDSPTMNAPIVPIIVEDVTEGFEPEKTIVVTDVTDVSEDNFDSGHYYMRNGKLQVACPNQTKSRMAPAIERFPDIIDVTSEQTDDAFLHGQDSRDDYEPVPGPTHSSGLSLAQILLETYNCDIKDNPERSMWHVNSQDTLDDEVTIPQSVSKNKTKQIDLLMAALGLSSRAIFEDSMTPISNHTGDGREGAKENKRDGVDVPSGIAGSEIAPIDLTLVGL